MSLTHRIDPDGPLTAQVRSGLLLVTLAAHLAAIGAAWTTPEPAASPSEPAALQVTWVMPSRAAPDSPPSEPRVASERMNTPGSSATASMRTHGSHSAVTVRSTGPMRRSLPGVCGKSRPSTSRPERCQPAWSRMRTAWAPGATAPLIEAPRLPA